ncbi:MAG: alpha/beta hydrolase, partial [Actinomycetota bacterium]
MVIPAAKSALTRPAVRARDASGLLREGTVSRGRSPGRPGARSFIVTATSASVSRSRRTPRSVPYPRSRASGARSGSGQPFVTQAVELQNCETVASGLLNVQPKTPLPTVVLVPGGGSSVRGYFPELDARLQGRVRLLEVDPPGLDVAAGRRWLRNADHARVLAEAVRRDGAAPVVVVGHSLGGLVALRLALDEPELVAGLLL